MREPHAPPSEKVRARWLSPRLVVCLFPPQDNSILLASHFLLCVPASVAAKKPETRQHSHTPRHHPHRTLPHAGVRVSSEYGALPPGTLGLGHLTANPVSP